MTSSIILVALFMMGCAASSPGTTRLNRRSPQGRFFSVWAGIAISYKYKGSTPSYTVTAVEEGKPASRAGLQAGDKIVYVESRNAECITIRDIAKKFRKPGRGVDLRVKREGYNKLLAFTIKGNGTNPVQQMRTRADLTSRGSRSFSRRQTNGDEGTAERQSARRSSMRRLPSNQGTTSGNRVNAPVTDPFEIPGVPARDTKAIGINELKRIYLDPSSGRLVFVGTYNKEYATGAIDYSALLNDALKSPSPVFSLEPTPESKNAVFAFFAHMDQQMKRNLSSVEAGKAWLTRIFDLLLSDPSLGIDRRRFFKKGADILKCKPEDMPEITQALLGRAHQGTPAFAKFESAFYKSQGDPQMALFLRSGDDPNATVGALEWMGLGPLRQNLLNKIRSKQLTQAQGELLLQIALWRFNYRTMKVPEYRWKHGLAHAEATFNETALRKVTDNLNAALFTERVMEPWLNGMIFSEQFLHRMFNMPTIETTPSCREGLSPDSELARTFLEADWYLKTLTQEPELAQKVPGHVTRGQFLFQRESQRGQYNTNGVEGRFWLQPESAPLSYDFGRRVISFKTPKVSVNAELLSIRGATPAVSAMARDGLVSYGKLITRNYEGYAKALPPLHRLREAAKVLAFVNWAHAQGINLRPPEPPAPPAALPARFRRGFWTAQFVSQNDRTFIEYSAEGGVDFGQSVGSNWIDAREDDTLGKTATEQLAGSAALGKQAVDAALNGDLDQARTLADKSALAMTGEYDFSANPALPQIPEASPPAPIFQAELQTEAIRQTKKALDTLHSGDPHQKAQATRKLQQIRKIITTPSPSPARIHAWVKLLRMDAGVAQVTQPLKPVIEKTIVTPVTEPRKSNSDEITATEKARILDEITDLRRDLCRIQTQLRRFNATIQADQAQRGEWEKTVDAAYNNALSRAKDKLTDFTVDFPAGLLEDRLKKITDPAERVKLERAFKMVQHLKEAYKLKDFSQWAANEHYSRKEIIDGFKLIGNVIGADEKIKEYLIKRWGLGRVLAYKDAAGDLITSAYDVTAEVLSWQRLAQLNRNSDAFLTAIKKLAQHQRDVMEQIHAREIRLGLKPGETKGTCP